MTTEGFSLRCAIMALLLAWTAGSNAFAQVPAGMVRIEGGTYRPLLARPGDASVHVGSFALDTVPVTLAALNTFNGLRRSPTSARQPATQVSWHDAQAFCRSRSARLPTTSEWEYVARASETDRNAAAGSAFRERVLRLALSAQPGSFLVGSAFRNVWGVYDMHGGLAEWTADFAGGTTAGLHTGHEEKSTCGSGTARSEHASDYAAFLRASYRAALTKQTAAANLGFRCAADLPRR